MKNQDVTHLLLPAFVAVVLSISTPAHAYIDPGAGSMLLQLLLGGLAGAFVVGRLFWRSIIAAISRPFSKFRKQNNTAALNEVDPSELRHADVKE